MHALIPLMRATMTTSNSFNRDEMILLYRSLIQNHPADDIIARVPIYFKNHPVQIKADQ